VCRLHVRNNSVVERMSQTLQWKDERIEAEISDFKEREEEKDRRLRQMQREMLSMYNNYKKRK